MQWAPSIVNPCISLMHSVHCLQSAPHLLSHVAVLIVVEPNLLLCVQNAMGPQCLSTLASAPASGFGTAKRPSMATKSGVPGPGAYKLKNTVGEALAVRCPALLSSCCRSLQAQGHC